MSYQMFRTVRFPFKTSLPSAFYQLYDANDNPVGAPVTSPAFRARGGTDIWGALLTIPDGHVGYVLFSSGEVDSPILGILEINPCDGENLDQKISTPVLLNGSAPVTFRNQDAVTAPTVADCLQAGWHDAFGKESEDGTSYVKTLPGSSSPARTFTLTRDANGNPIARS